MDRRPRTPRSQAQLAIAVTAALGFVAGLLTARLLSERDALLDKVKAWNKRATELDASLPSLPALQLESSPISTSSASSCAVCDPEDSEAKFRMRPKAEVARENPELVSLLAKHAINNEIMLTLANGIMICKNTTICWWNGGNILESFLTILSRAKITNSLHTCKPDLGLGLLVRVCGDTKYLIGVMDDETEQYLKGRDVNYFRVNIPVPKVQAKSHPANQRECGPPQVSTIKYTLLKTLLQLGVNTLITDMDLVYISNPFDHLHRDADIEVQTDGFDDMAYGQLESVHDPSMGWGGGGLYFHTFTTNVGCMWVKANARSFKLMAQVSDHLSQRQGWDQQIFNEYLMRPSHGDFQNAYAHLRVMDYTLFMNSKIFFRSRRTEYIPGATSKAPTPVMVHFNYHPDKHKRMLCIMDSVPSSYGELSASEELSYEYSYSAEESSQSEESSAFEDSSESEESFYAEESSIAEESSDVEESSDTERSNNEGSWRPDEASLSIPEPTPVLPFPAPEMSPSPALQPPATETSTSPALQPPATETSPLPSPASGEGTHSSPSLDASQLASQRLSAAIAQYNSAISKVKSANAAAAALLRDTSHELYLALETAAPYQLQVSKLLSEAMGDGLQLPHSSHQDWHASGHQHASGLSQQLVQNKGSTADEGAQRRSHRRMLH
ncbi:hypothetical protein QJQ45_007084 [Haematococcus lacustris]|nr:hypothetical protein QJQ45_007084 [Haematococcus lacustris]